MKVIMVPVADRPECRHALAVAGDLAERFQANLVGCHLRPHRSEKLQRGGFQFNWLIGREAGGEGLESESAARLKSAAARKLFADVAQSRGLRLAQRIRVGGERSAQWHELVGSLEHLFSIAGPMSDLSLVSRPKNNARGRSIDFMLGAILYSGRPVLVLPQRRLASLGQRVTIAWNQSGLAARAVSAAMPLLQSAESVHIVVCGKEDRPGPKSAALVRYLAQWGVASTREVTAGRKPEQELDAVCKKRKSDLVVMGAYSRSRMRQVVWGGFTQHMLFNSTRPVFLVHD